MESEVNRLTLPVIAVELWLDNIYGLDLLSIGVFERTGTLENDLFLVCHKPILAVAFKSL